MALPAIIAAVLNLAGGAAGGGGNKSDASGVLGKLMGPNIPGGAVASPQQSVQAPPPQPVDPLASSPPPKEPGMGARGWGNLVQGAIGTAAKMGAFRPPQQQGFPKFPFPMPQPPAFNPFVQQQQQAPQMPDHRYNLGMGRFRLGRRG